VEIDWLYWFIAALLFFAIEVLTPTFYISCLGMGAVIAGLIGVLTNSLPLEIVTFTITSFVSFLTIRPLALRITKSHPSIKTNVDALVNQVGYVTRTIGPGLATGEVRINSQYWRAVCSDGCIINTGESVVILKIEGAKLVVKPFQINRESEQ